MIKICFIDVYMWPSALSFKCMIQKTLIVFWD